MPNHHAANAPITRKNATIPPTIPPTVPGDIPVEDMAVPGVAVAEAEVVLVSEAIDAAVLPGMELLVDV